jgi:hypothetical protein
MQPADEIAPQTYVSRRDLAAAQTPEHPLFNRVVSLLCNNTSAIGAKRTPTQRQPRQIYGFTVVANS